MGRSPVSAPLYLDDYDYRDDRRRDYDYRDARDSAVPPMGTGFAEALSEVLAQGGGRTTNPRSRKAGARYTQGRNTRGKTMAQVVQDTKRKWVSAPQAVRDKYAGRAAALADSPAPAAPMAPPAPAPTGAAPVAAPARVGATAVTPPTVDSLRAYIQAPGTSIPAAPAARPAAPVAVSPPAPVTAPPMDGGNMVQRMIGNMVPVPAVSAPLIAGAATTSKTPERSSLGGVATNDSIFLGETPPDAGYTLVGSVGGQKKWAKGADMTALNAGAAAQTTANSAIKGTTVTNPVAAKPQRAVTPPAPQGYRSLGAGQGVAPTAKVVPEPPMSYPAYDQARTDLKQNLTPGSPEARATFGRMKDFEDNAAAQQATVERRKRLMVAPR